MPVARNQRFLRVVWNVRAAILPHANLARERDDKSLSDPRDLQRFGCYSLADDFPRMG